MSFDPITMALAKKQTIASLVQEGRIGENRYTTLMIDEKTVEFSSNPDLYGLAAVSGNTEITSDIAVYEVRVYWDEKVYRFRISGGNEYDDIEVGNSALVDGGVATDHPFYLAIIRDDHSYVIVAEQPGRHFFRISYTLDTTPKTIDPKFLPDECTPAVVDLTKYPTTGGVQDGISINDQVMYMVNASMTYGGAVQTATIELNDDSLAKDFAAKPNVIVKTTAYMIDTGGYFEIYYPATVSIKQETKLCSNAHCYSTLNLGVLVNVECCFVFGTSGSGVTISIKTTPWA